MWNNPHLSGYKRLREDGSPALRGESKRGRKRVKFSNEELCIEAHPHLREYARQRSLEHLGPNLFQNRLQQVSVFDVKPLAKQMGVSEKFFVER